MPPTIPNRTTSLRLADDVRALIELHGSGELSLGVQQFVSRHHALMRQSLPELSLEQCKALCGALKGYPLWAASECIGRLALGQALALEVHDYQWAEEAEASQFALTAEQWQELEQTCSAMTDLQVMAVGYAVEAVFAARSDTDLDAVVRRHFRVRPA